LLALGSRQILVAEPAKARRRHLRTEACIPTGKPCPSKKPRGHNKHGKARILSCNRCCQRHTAVVNGQVQCACQPNGQPCEFTTECCLGVCTGGVCIATTPSPPPPPVCTPLGDACTEASVCCAGICLSGPDVCCLEPGSACTSTSECCEGLICDSDLHTCGA
jgi:hypothetical protein